LTGRPSARFAPESAQLEDDRAGRSCRRPVTAADGQRLPELAAGGEIELGEDLAQVVLDGARAEEQLGGDLRVRQARPGQPRDLGLLGREVTVRAGGAPAGALAGRQQFAAGPLGRRPPCPRAEHALRRAPLRPPPRPAAPPAPPPPPPPG